MNVSFCSPRFLGLSLVFASLVVFTRAGITENVDSKAPAVLKTLPAPNPPAVVSPPKNYTQAVTSAVGQVGGEVVTSREVQISFAIDQVLMSQAVIKKSLDRSSWLITPGTEAFRAHLSQVLLELLIKMEAESFSVAQVSAEDVKADMALAKDSLKDWSEWKKWDVTDLELERLVFRRKMAKNFLKFKTESSGVVVTDVEVKAYFEKNRVKFGAAPLEQFKEGIRDVLAQQQLEEKLKDWFEVLKRKYRVRFLKSPEA